MKVHQIKIDFNVTESRLLKALEENILYGQKISGRSVPLEIREE